MLGPRCYHYICGTSIHFGKFGLNDKGCTGWRQGNAVVREGLLLYAIQIDMGQETYLEKYLQLILFVLSAFP